MVQTTRNFQLFDKKQLFGIEKKRVKNSWQSVDAILEDISVTDSLMLNLKAIIFQFSKNYSTPTLVTWLKVAPNMADPISLNELTVALSHNDQVSLLEPVTSVKVH